MLKKIAIGASIFAILFFFACKKESNARTVTANNATLAHKECVYFLNKNATICFVDALESRCPCGADCLWIGSCDVTLKLTTPEIDSTFHLSWSPESAFPAINKDTIGGLAISVTKILPNDCNAYGDYANYLVDVVIE